MPPYEKRKLLLLGMVVFSVLLTSFSFYFYQLFYGKNILTQTEDRVFLIDNDDTFDSVRNHLYDERIIEDAVSFSFVSKILDYPELVKPGVYRFKKQMTNLEAVRMLRSGEQFPVRITLNNIRLKEELSKKITASIGIASDAFLYLLEDESF